MPTEAPSLEDIESLLRQVHKRRWGCIRDHRALTVELFKLAEAGRFQDALSRAGRDYGPVLLCDWWWERGYLTVNQLRKLLPGVWTGVEFPSSEFGVRHWLNLFKAAGFVTDSPGLIRPKVDISIFRGCTRRTRWRLAWTTDLGEAKFFANRLTRFGSPDAVVYSADCPPRHVLGLIQDRGENEVVANPWGLRNWNIVMESTGDDSEVPSETQYRHSFEGQKARLAGS